MAEDISLLIYIFTNPFSDPPPESPIASQLLEAIRAKESTEKLGEILDSLSSIDPDSEFIRYRAIVFIFGVRAVQLLLK